MSVKKSLILLGSLIVCGSTVFGVSSKVFALDAKAGPIWNNKDAKTKCPAACAAINGRWNGQWRTVVQGRSSVCGCK